MIPETLISVYWDYLGSAVNDASSICFSFGLSLDFKLTDVLSVTAKGGD